MLVHLFAMLFQCKTYENSLSPSCSQLDHRYVVKLYDVFDDEQYLDLVIECLNGGEMFERIVDKGQYNEADTAFVIKQLAEGLKYLHTQGIVHRDLKPENLLYENSSDDCNIKITDFGLAKLTDGENPALMRTACGTPGYVAPEILSGKSYGQEVDIWSLGVIMYILLCGFPPFYSENDAELYALIRTATYSFPSPYWDNISKEARTDIDEPPLKRSTEDTGKTKQLPETSPEPPIPIPLCQLLYTGRPCDVTMEGIP